MVNKRRYVLKLALISAVLLGSEVLLTRYYSTVMSVSMVYFVVSTTLFGTGIGAYITYTRLKDQSHGSISNHINKCINWLAGSMILFWSFALLGPYVDSPGIYIMGSTMIYIFGGMAMSSIYMKESKRGHELYCSDLIGAVLGCLVVVYAMMNYNFYIGLAAMFLLMVPTFIPSEKGLGVGVIGPVVFLIIGMALFSGDAVRYLETHFDAYFENPNKGIQYIAKGHATDVEVIYSSWGAFSRTDVVKLKENDGVRYILTDGGATAPIVAFDGDLSKLDYLQNDVTYLPHDIGRNDKTLLIGSGGGKDVLYALLSGSRDITAVEINESTIEAVRTMDDYSGDIYNREGVELVVGDGRKFVDQTDQTFDHIYLSMVMSGAVDNSRLSLVENFIFTQEAFASYKDAIKEDGRISFMVHNGVEAIRVANTWIKTLLEAGVAPDQVNEYFVIVNGMKNQGDQISPVHMPTVILKKTPFLASELDSINDFLLRENVVAMHLPQTPNELYAGLSQGTMTYEETIGQLDVNVRPVEDSNPFFYKYTKGMTLELVPLIGLVVAGGLYLGAKGRKNGASFERSAYFSTIGVGYILIELGFIQSMQRYLEKPIYGFTFVLLGILLGSALGALLSGKIKVIKNIRRQAPFMIALVAVFGYQWITKLMGQTYMLTISEKLLLVLPVILLVGFFMGIPFPYAIESMHGNEEEKKQIPLMYAFNGTASILGSIIALRVAMAFGFGAVVMVGAAVYAVLGLGLSLSRTVKN